MQNKKLRFLAASKCSTLFRYCETSNVESIKKESFGRMPVLTNELEIKLVEYILKNAIFGLTRRDVCSIAFQLARQYIPNPFSLLYQSVGKIWLRRFMCRHKNRISSTATSVARASGFTQASINKFFDLLEKAMEENNFSFCQILNVDECGISIVQSKCLQILALKGNR